MPYTTPRRKQLDHERYMRNREERKERQKKYYREHWMEYKLKRCSKA